MRVPVRFLRIRGCSLASWLDSARWCGRKLRCCCCCGMVLLAKWWRPADWTKLVRAGLLLGLGLVLPLLPWAARNWRTLHEVQFLAPRYSELPGEYTPLGFTAWTSTWLWRFRDVYLTQWKVNDEEIRLTSFPRRPSIRRTRRRAWRICSMNTTRR